MAKAVVIRNPVSGRSRLATRWPDVQRRLSEVFSDAEFLNTVGPGDATALARQAVDSGCSTVIAVGGDGTVTQVANCLVGSQTALGVVPAGTGNDLCRTLGIGASVEIALQALEDGNLCQMDVGRWTTDRGTGYFLNIAGMGFDAAVADRINRGFRSLRGTAAYLAAVVATLASYRARDLRITIDGGEVQEKAMLVAVANARCYGGGMQVAPMASIFDGVLEVVLVRELGRIAFLSAFPRVFKGSHMSHAAVRHYRGCKIRLDPVGEAPFLVDGELVPCQWAEIDVVPGGLKIIAPKRLCDTTSP